jgi:hypothetical protein
MTSYTLDHFCRDLRDLLKVKDSDVLSQIAGKLEILLANPDFVAATFAPDTPAGKRMLFHDPASDAYVLAHVQQAGKGGRPHSHGASWAIYGNALGHTEMTEWRRTNPASEDHAVLEASATYRLGPGQSRAYGPGVIHSTAHPEKAWVIRITGTDLDAIPRYRFAPQTDRIAADRAAPG